MKIKIILLLQKSENDKFIYLVLTLAQYKTAIRSSAVPTYGSVLIVPAGTDSSVWVPCAWCTAVQLGTRIPFCSHENV